MSEQNAETKVVYEMTLPYCYDLEKQPYRRFQMINEHIPKNVKRSKTIEAFRARLVSQLAELEMRANPIIARWFSVSKQVEFLDKVISGEINIAAEQAANTPVDETKGVDAQ